jgi:tetratricopeptide (TPR) repeat protein
MNATGDTNSSREAILAALISEACGALLKAGECLLQAVDAVPAKASRFAQLYYVRDQARCVATVAIDVHLLVVNHRLDNVVGLCRVAFESRINLYAAMRVPHFAAQKLLGQAQGNVREFEEVAKGAPSNEVFQQALADHRRLLQQMREDYAGVAERTWKIKEAARDAGLLDDYNDHYSILSKAAHNTPAGLAAKTDPHTASSLLRLLHDTLETAAALVFFREGENATPQPVTQAWEELIQPLETLREQYTAMFSRLDVVLANFTPEHL